jgi:hypothetical protein
MHAQGGNVFLLYLEALHLQGKEEKDAHKSTLEAAGGVFLLSIAAFLLGKKERKMNLSTKHLRKQ